MDFIVENLVTKYGKQLRSIPGISIVDAEEICEYFHQYNNKIQDGLFKAGYCGKESEFCNYIGDLIHETNSQANMATNNLRNLYYYFKLDKRRGEEIRKKFFTQFNMFVLGLESLEIFYNYVYKKGE